MRSSGPSEGRTRKALLEGLGLRVSFWGALVPPPAQMAAARCSGLVFLARFAPRTSIVYRPVVDVSGSTLVLAWRELGTLHTEAFRAVVAEVRLREAAFVAQIEAAKFQS